MCLLYVGDGQYYDPQTGRFLTRGSNPNSANPYLPFDPTGAMLGPLGLLALVLGSKKKKSKVDVLLFVLVFSIVSGVTLSACGNGQTPTPIPSNSPTFPPPNVGITPAPQQSSTPPSTPPNPYYDPEEAVNYALQHYNNPNPEYLYYDPNISNDSDCTNFISQALYAGGLTLENGIWEPYNLTWIQTPKLHEYLSKKFQDALYTNDQYISEYSFQPLRGYPKWEGFLNNNAININAGDLVFYWDNDYGNWSHVAMITSNIWKPETTHVLQKDPSLIQFSAPGALKPEIVEHHGPTYNGPEAQDVPRSIDDTANLRIKFVSIIFMSRPKVRMGFI